MFDSPLLTNAEAAAYLKMSPRTLDRWRWAQRGPVFKKIGGSICGGEPGTRQEPPVEM